MYYGHDVEAAKEYVKAMGLTSNDVKILRNSDEGSVRVVTRGEVTIERD